MNISSSTVQGRGAFSPAAPAAPAAVAGVLSKLWQGLQRAGQMRAARHLDLLARQYRLSDPALARQMLEAAAECRAGGPSSEQGDR